MTTLIRGGLVHVAVADGKVRPYTAVRTCLDFNV